MAVQKLVLDTFEEDDYELIAIHSSLASYRLTFLLNKYLNLNLFRTREDLYFEYSSLVANFPLYTFDDRFKYTSYSLFGNKFRGITTSKTSISDGLFPDPEKTYTTKYLIPELKNVDYFLKIDSESSSSLGTAVIAKIQAISQVITAYSVAYHKLKSKNNLIFV